MAKINRRDYLKGMTAGAGALVSARTLDCLAEPSLKKDRVEKLTTGRKRKNTTAPSWLTTSTLAPPTVTAYFWGIMGIKPKGRQCEIGFHVGSPTHNLVIRVFENCTSIYDSSQNGGLPTQARWELGIVGKENTPNVSFYHGAGNFDRTDANFDAKDFRWWIDLEDRDFFGTVYAQLDLKSNVYRKRLVVKHGQFFTHVRNKSTYDVEGGPKNLKGIYVASMIGLGIELAAGECVYLRQGQNPLIPDLCQASGKKYEIHFSNECQRPNGKECYSSDFYLNFDAVNIHHSERFELFVNELKRTPSPGLCKIRTKGGQEIDIKLSDEAPCMGVGYGSGGDLPAYPPG